MTEDEAKTRWCPFARTLETADFAAAAAVNREPGSYDQQGNETVVVGGRHRCVASACMAWRWNDHAETSGTWAEGYRPGHCGLAGSP